MAPRRSVRLSSNSKQQKISTFFKENKETVDIFLDTEDLDFFPPKKRGRKPKNKIVQENGDEEICIEEHSSLQELSQDSINIETCSSAAEEAAITPPWEIASEENEDLRDEPSNITNENVVHQENTTVPLSLFDTPRYANTFGRTFNVLAHQETGAFEMPPNRFTQIETRQPYLLKEANERAQNVTQGEGGIRPGELTKFELTGDEDRDNFLFCFSVAQAVHKNRPRTLLQNRFPW